MQFQDDKNPYAPPIHTDQRDRYEPGREPEILAERGTRWFARFIDGLINLVSVVPVGLVLFSTDVLNWRDLQQNQLAGVIFWAAALPVSLYQWSLVSRTGQTIGKKMLGIRVVKVDGSPVDFTSGVAMREWITTVIGFIPLLGGLVSFVGILLIFGDERRCLHDRLAGTKVIRVLTP